MLEDAFNKNVSNYNLDNPDIKLKYNHSFRVMKLQEKYAKLLGWNDEILKYIKERLENEGIR